MRLLIGIVLCGVISGCGLAQESTAVGPIVAHNPTVGYLEYTQTHGLKNLQAEGSMRAASLIGVAASIAQRCDFVEINENSHPFVKQNLSRAALLKGKAAMKEDVAQVRAAYASKYNVSFAPDATSNLCYVAEKEFSAQSGASAYLIDQRLSAQ